MSAFDSSPLPIPSSGILALEILFDRVVARFTADAIPCEFAFGWREPPRQGKLPQAHIVITPGDPSGRLAKSHTGARYPGQLPIRSVGGMWELFTARISAQDPAASNDDRAQYRATRLLYDAWLRAVYLSGFGNFSIESDRWLVTRKEGRFGAALEVVGGILAVIPDSALTLAPVDVKAEITESLLATADPVVEMLPES